MAIHGRLLIAGLLFAGMTSLASARQEPGLSPYQGGLSGGPEVLARGPIHEAFASPVVFNPTPGVVVPKPPPQTLIEESPPAEKPAGADVEWISGYWSWDDQRNDFIWISGIWRDLPPGRQWVTGYWSQAQGGFAWTSGFWAPIAAANTPIDYLPVPPRTLENGPNTPPPGENFAWAPGCWLWQGDRYAWRPGVWVQSQPNWVWVPSNYVATPSGYVYVGGYWDYNLAQRGMPFAPVAFGPSFYAQPRCAYTPSFALSVSGMLGSLFVRPTYNAYYFGDYYGPVGQGPRPGYYPFFEYQERHIGYDPIYASMYAANGGRPGWDRAYREEYIERVRNVDSRPRETYVAQREFIAQREGRGENVRNLALAQPLNQWARNGGENRRMVPVGEDHRAELTRRQESIREFSQARARQETQARIPENVRHENHQPQRIEIPRSPVVAASQPRFQSQGLAQPPPHAQPHPNANFRPEPGHREPAPPPHRGEARPRAEARPHEEARPRVEGRPHEESRPKPEGRPHEEPRREGGEREKGGKPKR